MAAPLLHGRHAASAWPQACSLRHAQPYYPNSTLCCTVVASEKGVVVGRLSFREDGDLINCQRMGVGGKAVPPNVDKARSALLTCIMLPSRLASAPGTPTSGGHAVCCSRSSGRQGGITLKRCRSRAGDGGAPAIGSGDGARRRRWRTSAATPCSSCWWRRTRPSCAWPRTASTTPTPASSSRPRASRTLRRGARPRLLPGRALPC